MKWNWNLAKKIGGLFSRTPLNQAPMKGLDPATIKQMARRASMEGLDAALVKQMARSIATTRPDEIGCAECFDEIDRFVDLELAGKNAVQALPLVRDHLDRCNNCREEFEALQDALRAVA